MITSASQWTYIIASYGLTALVVAGLITWVIFDGRRYAAALADLEARGVKRRSASGDKTP